MLVEQRLGLRKEAGRGHHYAVALDGFHNQSGDVALTEFRLKGGDVAERDLRTGQQRPEARLELFGAVDG